MQGAINVQEMLSCFCGWQGYAPQIRLMNRVVSREPGGNISIRYPLLHHHRGDSVMDPKSLLSIANTVTSAKSAGTNLLAAIFSPHRSCSSPFLLLPFPSCSHYSHTRQLPPPTSPHPQISAFNALFPPPWLFSAPCTEETPGRKAVTLPAAALTQQPYRCCIKGGGKNPSNPSFKRLYTSHLLAEHPWEKSGLLRLTLPGAAIRSCIYSPATVLMLFCICCAFTSRANVVGNICLVPLVPATFPGRRFPLH